MTRDRDVFIPLNKRPSIANETPNSIFVSVHFNSGRPHANGFEVFAITPRGAPSTSDKVLRTRDYREEPGNSVDVPSAALASSVYHSMLGHLTQIDRGLKRARFAVIRQATVPSILVEGGFISNAEEAKQIHDPEWREQLAKSIAAGVLGYKGLSELNRPPELMADYRREKKEETAQKVEASEAPKN
jgi:N-acetylmuramoyl-L-alanine amidase